MSIFDESGSLKRDAGVTLKELAERLDCHREKLSSIERGNAGCSPSISRKAADVYDEAPATVFLTSQVRALKYKMGLENLGPARVLQSAGLTIKGLQGFDATEKDEDDPEFIEAAQELAAIAEKALTLDMAAGAGIGNPATKSSGTDQLETLGRDGAGRKVVKKHAPKSDRAPRRTDGTRPRR